MLPLFCSLDWGLRDLQTGPTQQLHGLGYPYHEREPEYSNELRVDRSRGMVCGASTVIKTTTINSIVLILRCKVLELTPHLNWVGKLDQ